MPDARRARLLAAMRLIKSSFASPDLEFRVRTHRPGDMGWITHRHAVIYGSEYGWNAEFEAMVAEITVDFIRRFDPATERCWIAEDATGNVLGSVLLKRKSKTVAQLRLLYVEADARGMGVGHHLVKECITFARRKKYRKIVLWTNDILHAARRIYQQEGFTLVEEEKHFSFGKKLVGQFWEMKLGA